MTLASDMIADALEAIQEVGRQMILEETQQTVNPVTGIPDITATQTQTLWFSPPLELTDEMVADDTVPANSSYFVLPASGLAWAPTIGMRVLDGAAIWAILKVITHEVQSSAVAYELIVS